MIKSYSFVILLLAFSTTALCRQHGRKHLSGNPSGKIVGGETVTIEQYKYQAQVLPTTLAGSFFCGGIILSSRYVLTAAHCLQGALLVRIRAGTSYLNGTGGFSTLALRFMSHPLYNPVTIDYDVGIVQALNSIPINGRTIAPIALPPQGYEVAGGLSSTASGWGLTSENGELASQLQAVSIPIVDRATCSQNYENVTVITNNMLCAGVVGKDPCQGDSGGPLVDSQYVIGIVSFGVGCAREGYPGVFAKVSAPAIRSFIKRQTNL